MNGGVEIDFYHLEFLSCKYPKSAGNILFELLKHRQTTGWNKSLILIWGIMHCHDEIRGLPVDWKDLFNRTENPYDEHQKEILAKGNGIYITPKQLEQYQLLMKEMQAYKKRNLSTGNVEMSINELMGDFIEEGCMKEFFPFCNHPQSFSS